MILNDFIVPKSKYSNETLDKLLAELCELVIKGKQDNPDFSGWVGAAVITPEGLVVTGTAYRYGNKFIHAERAAIDKYEAEYGELPKGCIVVTTLSPCNEDHDETATERQGDSCTDLLNAKQVKLAYCGYNDPTQEHKHNNFTVIITENEKLKSLCKQMADTFLKKGLREDSDGWSIAIKPEFEELARACDNWYAMEYTPADIQFILNSPYSKPYKKPAEGHHTLYRCIFPNDKVAESERDARGFVSYATTLRGAEVFRTHTASTEPYYIIEKKLVPSDFLLNFTSLYEMVMSEMGVNYDSESEVWMKRSPYYTTHTEDEIIVNHYWPEEVNEGAEPSRAKQFIDNVYSQYPDWPYGQADKVMVWGEGEDQQFAAFKLKPGAAPDTVEIDWIMAGPEQRQGVGSRAIKELQRQAQEAGIKLTLYPWAKGNVSQASLTKLYKRHGFKPVAKGAKPMRWEPQLDELKIDNVNGLGSVPWNQEVDYMGLRVLMKPSTFLHLSLPLNMNDDDKKTIDHLEKEIDTKGFGAPFLQVDMDREFPRITDHDGRHRMMAIKELEGDKPVEVHIFPKGMRNKDMTPEVINKLNDLVVSQNGKYVPGPIFTQAVSENFADGKGPGRPGDSQRHGIPKGASMSELEKASHSKGRKGQLARWQLNMRRGHKK